MKQDETVLYLARETKGTKDFEKLRNTETDKIFCGSKHFEKLDVNYDVYDIIFDVTFNYTEQITCSETSSLIFGNSKIYNEKLSLYTHETPRPQCSSIPGKGKEIYLAFVDEGLPVGGKKRKRYGCYGC